MKAYAAALPVTPFLWRRYRDRRFHREDDPERPVLQVRGQFISALRGNIHSLGLPYIIDRNPRGRTFTNECVRRISAVYVLHANCSQTHVAPPTMFFLFKLFRCPHDPAFFLTHVFNRAGGGRCTGGRILGVYAAPWRRRRNGGGRLLPCE